MSALIKWTVKGFSKKLADHANAIGDVKGVKRLQEELPRCVRYVQKRKYMRILGVVSKDGSFHLTCVPLFLPAGEKARPKDCKAALVDAVADLRPKTIYDLSPLAKYTIVSEAKYKRDEEKEKMSKKKAKKTAKKTSKKKMSKKKTSKKTSKKKAKRKAAR